MCGDHNAVTRCHCIVDISGFGLEGKGCIMDDEWRASISIPSSVNPDDDSYVVYLPHKKVRIIGKLDDGSYGIIYGAEREKKGRKHLVVIKRPKIPGSSLLKEALIQYVVGESLIRGGFLTGASRIYDIFTIKDGSVCFSMEPMKGASLQDIIKNTIGFSLTKIIIECLFHISAMLSHLEKDIGMNHRDLKPSNIILRFHDSPVSKGLAVNGNRIVLKSQMEVSLIDFGFSCIRELRNGDVYDSQDACPKDGRDIYMFLAFLYILIHKKLTVELDALFCSWLNTAGNDVTTLLKSEPKKGQRDIEEWVYYLAGNPDIKQFKTTPERIFGDLKRIM